MGLFNMGLFKKKKKVEKTPEMKVPENNNDFSDWTSQENPLFEDEEEKRLEEEAFEDFDDYSDEGAGAERWEKPKDEFISEAEFKEKLRQWREKMDPWLEGKNNVIENILKSSDIENDDKFIYLRHINSDQFELLKERAEFLLDKMKDDCIEIYYNEPLSIEEKKKKFSKLEPSEKTKIFEAYCGYNYNQCYDTCEDIFKKYNKDFSEKYYGIYGFDLKDENDDRPFLSESAILLSKIIEEEFVNKRPGYKKENKINPQDHSQISPNATTHLERYEKNKQQDVSTTIQKW